MDYTKSIIHIILVGIKKWYQFIITYILHFCQVIFLHKKKTAKMQSFNNYVKYYFNHNN